MNGLIFLANDDSPNWHGDLDGSSTFDDECSVLRNLSCCQRAQSENRARLVSDEMDNRKTMLKVIKPKTRRKRGIFAHHSLSIASLAILILWIILYAVSNPKTHWGSFFGNAIADWSGVVVMVIATKYLYELGSAESRKPPLNLPGSLLEKIKDHSLTLFLLVTGLCWAAVYMHDNPESKWGQVVGNVLSEWTQILALVIMTKRLVEPHSKESKK